MAIEMILAPIKEDLQAFEGMIDDFLGTVQLDRIRANYETFFRARGKYLRPSLLMLATGATAGDRNRFDQRLYRLGLILELLHSASLVHDDIVDDDLERRGEKTVNQVFGNKIAVLAGDTLFSYAFKEATVNYDRAYNVPITSLALNMCMAELEQANEVDSLESYLRVIKGKTAEFMSVACELGARYGGGDDGMIQTMSELGMAIGMTYQMVDDIIDEDPNAMKYISRADIDQSYEKAASIMDGLEPNVYVTSLKMLLDFIMGMMK